MLATKKCMSLIVKVTLDPKNPRIHEGWIRSIHQGLDPKYPPNNSRVYRLDPKYPPREGHVGSEASTNTEYRLDPKHPPREGHVGSEASTNTGVNKHCFCIVLNIDSPAIQVNRACKAQTITLIASLALPSTTLHLVPEGCIRKHT